MKIRDLNSYRHLIAEPDPIPVLNRDLRVLLYRYTEVKHPFFLITPNEVMPAKEYAWDGATGAVNTTDLRIPSLIHDIGCQAVNLGLLPFEARALFDREYYLQCRLYDVPWVRARAHYLVIRAWGMFPKKEPGIAPYAELVEVEVRRPY